MQWRSKQSKSAWTMYDVKLRGAGGAYFPAHCRILPRFIATEVSTAHTRGSSPGGAPSTTHDVTTFCHRWQIL